MTVPPSSSMRLISARIAARASPRNLSVPKPTTGSLSAVPGIAFVIGGGRYERLRPGMALKR